MSGRVPEIFFTNVLKIEPVGGNCIRIYCTLERDGAHEEKVTLVVPVENALANCRFVMAAAAEIFQGTTILEARIHH